MPIAPLATLGSWMLPQDVVLTGVIGQLLSVHVSVVKVQPEDVQEAVLVPVQAVPQGIGAVVLPTGPPIAVAVTLQGLDPQLWVTVGQVACAHAPLNDPKVPFVQIPWNVPVPVQVAVRGQVALLVCPLATPLKVTFAPHDVGTSVSMHGLGEQNPLVKLKVPLLHANFNVPEQPDGQVTSMDSPLIAEE
jgi:hypothetical protein